MQSNLKFLLKGLSLCFIVRKETYGYEMTIGRNSYSAGVWSYTKEEIYPIL